VPTCLGIFHACNLYARRTSCIIGQSNGARFFKRSELGLERRGKIPDPPCPKKKKLDLDAHRRFFFVLVLLACCMHAMITHALHVCLLGSYDFGRARTIENRY
jgi:hypothetical protein